ncbi:AraC family transcriptional regulator [Cricetibacter osteomyelitidis]|uniref:AraC family transcriptional regulator n=1 Tax=Cricetibacter osteomyelitidis TaxID=1521931 RepID=A0A4R2T8G9_9PAST|nr:helix-turn-helix domain-containing protein [Cricetibacter osteomyelitidis]TCP91192.1 AraC family transcriptional regulator [Cricetibacter osteomyelitidis]
MDYLDRLIQLAQVQGEINVLCRFEGNWQVHHTQDSNAVGIFHIISQGECDVSLNNRHYHLTAGDVFFLSQGIPHHIANNAQHNAETVITNHQQGIFCLRSNHLSSYDFEMFCGYVHYSPYIRELLNLPDCLHLHGKENPQINALLQLLQNETSSQPSGKSIVDALCNVLFGYLVRDYVQHHQIHEGIIAALQDKRLRHAVNGILQQPEFEWNMENLAAKCAMSRANFIRLFKQKTGLPPGGFLTDVRMQKAEMLLRQSNKSVLLVSLAVGYKSESHFSQVFKERYGVSPSQFRSML